MLQELVSKTSAFRRALNDSGNIRYHNVALVIHTQNSEIRDFCGERIWRYFRARVCERRKKRRLSGIRKSDKPHISHYAELYPEHPCLAGSSRMRIARSLIGRCLEMDISPSAFSALQKRELLLPGRGRKIIYKLAGIRIPYCSSRRNRYHDILAVLSEAVPPLTVSAVLRLETVTVAQLSESPEITPHAENDISAFSSVAAVRSAMGNIFLTPE